MKVTKLIGCVFFLKCVCGLTHGLFAQDHSHYVDSVMMLVADNEDSFDKLSYLNQLAIYLKELDPDRALYFSRQALSLANQIQSAEACAISNQVMAEIFETKRNYQPSINYYLISIKHFKSLDKLLELSRLYLKLGHIYIENQFDYRQGMQYFEMALDFANQSGDQRERANALNAIGGIYYVQQEFDLAFDHFQKALKIRQTTGNEVELAASLNNVGEIYRIRGEIEEANEYYDRAIRINEKYHKLNYLAVNYLNKGLIASAQNQTEKAQEFFAKSLALNTQIADTIAIIRVLTESGQHFNQAEKYEEAIQTFEQLKVLAIKADHLEGQQNADHGLSLAYERKNEIGKALRHFKQYSYLKDSLFNQKKTEQLNELHTRFSLNLKEKELEIKDSEIALLKSEKEIFRSRQLLLILSLLLFAIIAVFIYSRLKLKHRKKRLLLEQEATLSKARQELMEKELHLKSNELTNYAMHLVEKNKFLHELKAELKKLLNISSEKREIRLKELTINVQQNINLIKDLKEFQQNIDIVNAAFFDKLKSQFPQLTKNEGHLCALLRMNLSSKEIASLNNISVRAVEMGRYRLRKKFNLSSENNLTEFLQQF